MLQAKNMALRWDTRRVRIDYFTWNRDVNCIHTRFWHSSVICDFYFPEMQALKKNWPAGLETHFQHMDVAPLHFNRPKSLNDRSDNQAKSVICIFQFSVVPWETQRILPHTSGLSSSGEEPHCLDRMHSPTAKHFLYLHSANGLKLNSRLSLSYKGKRSTGIVTCHAQVPQLIPLHLYSLQRDERQVPLTARSWSSFLSGQRTA